MHEITTHIINGNVGNCSPQETSVLQSVLKEISSIVSYNSTTRCQGLQGKRQHTCLVVYLGINSISPFIFASANPFEIGHCMLTKFYLGPTVLPMVRFPNPVPCLRKNCPSAPRKTSVSQIPLTREIKLALESSNSPVEILPGESLIGWTISLLRK